MVTSATSTTSTTSTSTSASASDASTLTTDYTTFLTLLTAQIKNQDPLSPMDTTEWTNQLVQYSSVEQEIKSNGYLETIAAASGSDNSMSTAVNYIGKTVGSSEDTATVTAGGSATWNYSLDADATSATMTITDSDGNTIWSDSADDLTAGTHSFTWDGKDSAGNAVDAGDYTLSVTASNASGSVTTSTGVSGVVTSAEDDDGTVVLKVGNSTIALDDITSVS
jgi:flagellar basal-body rod modification protein FlgD